MIGIGLTLQWYNVQLYFGYWFIKCAASITFYALFNKLCMFYMFTYDASHSLCFKITLPLFQNNSTV